MNWVQIGPPVGSMCSFSFARIELLSIARLMLFRALQLLHFFNICSCIIIIFFQGLFLRFFC